MKQLREVLRELDREFPERVRYYRSKSPDQLTELQEWGVTSDTWDLERLPERTRAGFLAVVSFLTKWIPSPQSDRAAYVAFLAACRLYEEEL